MNTNTNAGFTVDQLVEWACQYEVKAADLRAAGDINHLNLSGARNSVVDLLYKSTDPRGPINADLLNNRVNLLKGGNRYKMSCRAIFTL